MNRSITYVVMCIGMYIDMFTCMYIDLDAMRHSNMYLCIYIALFGKE